MMASQSKEMTTNNVNNNQSIVNLTRLTTTNQQVETSKQIARINKTINLTNFYKISILATRDINTRRTSTLVSIYVTQDKYKRRTSTLILCKHILVQTKQVNKGSANNNKHKTIDNDDNQTMYATARDRVRNSHGQ
jgi:hypothetical protein